MVGKFEEALRKKIEETPRRGRQVRMDRGRGKHLMYGMKLTGGGRIAGAGRCPYGRMTPGRCGVW